MADKEPNVEITSFEEFWPHYVSAHQSRGCRALHYVGTTLALSILIYAIIVGPLWLSVFAPLCGYGLAWIGHFFVEHNKPATFGHVWWSLLGDFKMLALALRGKMSAEVARLVTESTRTKSTSLSA